MNDIHIVLFTNVFILFFNIICYMYVAPYSIIYNRCISYYVSEIKEKMLANLLACLRINIPKRKLNLYAYVDRLVDRYIGR